MDCGNKKCKESKNIISFLTQCTLCQNIVELQLVGGVYACVKFCVDLKVSLLKWTTEIIEVKI